MDGGWHCVELTSIDTVGSVDFYAAIVSDIF